jgi:predicted DNA-binding WGR domain protein
MALAIAFTGTFELDARETHVDKAQKNGYKIAENIAKSTTYLVCGKNGGQAVEQAKRVGVRIISEEKWVKILRKMETNETGKKRARSDNNSKNGYQRKLVYLESRQHKRFWQMRRIYKTTYIRTGSIGTKGMETSKEHETKKLAKDNMISMIAAKKAAGFREANRPQILDYEDSSDSSDDNFDDVDKRKQKRQRFESEDSESDRTLRGDDDSEMSDVASKRLKNGPQNSLKILLNDGQKRQEDEIKEDVDGLNEDLSTAKNLHLPSFVTNPKILMSIMKGNSVDVLLAFSWKPEEVDPTGWWISEKLDGVRAFWDSKRGKFFSRNGNEFVAPSW